MQCPTCGKENAEENIYCNWCGNKMTGSTQSQSAAQSPQNQVVSQNTPVNQSSSGVEDEVRAVIIKRFDAIKNKDEKAVTALLDESYSKFDDWPPYQIQQRAQALQNEFTAFKVLSNYTYEIKDFKATVLGEAALSHLHHKLQSNHEKPTVRRNFTRNRRTEKTRLILETSP